jgi:hypothetical protein
VITHMSDRVRTIEVDAAVADVLEARAAARGISVSDLLADLAGAAHTLTPELRRLRRAARGPWSPEALDEDERRLAEFNRARAAVPWEEVRGWMRSWGTPDEQPSPKPRKL